jgi:hypothetical protein
MWSFPAEMPMWERTLVIVACSVWYLSQFASSSQLAFIHELAALIGRLR